MTWGEWKKWVEAHGVKDEDDIRYIDCSEPVHADFEIDECPDRKEPWRNGWAIW